MTKLRFLKFHSPGNKRSCIVNLPSGLELLSDSLRYLQWDNFPLRSLALSFCAEKLVELHMRNSRLKKLWDGVQNLVNLREIDFEGSKELMELPDFSAAQNLEHVNLENCSSLCHLQPSILSLPRLSYVKLLFCTKLKSLRIERQSKSISSLLVDGCSSLKEFSFSSDKITFLGLEDVRVKILDFSIGTMEELQSLYLNGSTLKYLPINEMCCNMRSLQQLHLRYCGGIIDKSKLHNLFDSLLALETISLQGTTKLTELPNNMKHLSRLDYLDVSHCKDLQSLPELPLSIQYLDARNCTSLKTLQLTSNIESPFLGDEIMLGSPLCSSVNYLRNLRKHTLSWCKQLCELPQSIGSLSSLHSLNLQGRNVESLPASIKHLSNLERLRLSNCRRLHSLPELPPFLEVVEADGCISLEVVHSSIISAPKLSFLYLNDCLKLENRSLSCVIEWAYFSMKRLAYTLQCASVCYPGREVPEWFSSNRVEDSKYITLDLPSTPNNLIGFIFCAVLSNDLPYRDLQCQLHYDGKKHKCSRFGSVMPNLHSHNVYLWCDSATFINVHKKMDDQDINYGLKVSFEFSVVSWDWKIVDGVIEACGVYPICASEYHNFIQEMESKSNLGTQKETCHDVEENSFHGILRYASLLLKQGKHGSFEGSVIPKWFPYRSSTISEDEGFQVSVELSPDFDNLKGFIFCFVIPHFSSKQRDQCHSSCDCYLLDRNGDRFKFKGPRGWHYSMVNSNSNNVFLWYDPLYCELVLQELRRRGKGNTEVLVFRFEFGEGLMEDWGSNIHIGGCLIKECGVRPIYVSEYTNFLQQNGLKVSTKRKRDPSIDEEDQHQLPLTKELKELVTAQGENRATTSENGDA